MTTLPRADRRGQPPQPRRLPADVSGLDCDTAAFVYADAGIPVVPFDPTRGKHKSCGNLMRGSQPWYRQVTTDKSQLAEWLDQFGRFRALATSPGEVGWLVIDVDKPTKFPIKWRGYLEDQSVPYVNTRPSVHPRYGHYWFSLPDGVEVGNRRYPWGDLRCAGGGIVLPPYHNVETGDDRRIVRCGTPPVLPDELIEAFVAEAGVVSGAAIDLNEFFATYAQNAKPYKLKGLISLHDRELAKTNPHNAMREALKVGFSEAIIGYVPAKTVLTVLAESCWDRDRYELINLARWCAAWALAQDSQAIRNKSDRPSGMDSRLIADALQRKPINAQTAKST